MAPFRGPSRCLFSVVPALRLTRNSTTGSAESPRGPSYGPSLNELTPTSSVPLSGRCDPLVLCGPLSHPDRPRFPVPPRPAPWVGQDLRQRISVRRTSHFPGGGGGRQRPTGGPTRRGRRLVLGSDGPTLPPLAQDPEGGKTPPTLWTPVVSSRRDSQGSGNGSLRGTSGTSFVPRTGGRWSSETLEFLRYTGRPESRGETSYLRVNMIGSGEGGSVSLSPCHGTLCMSPVPNS